VPEEQRAGAVPNAQLRQTRRKQGTWRVSSRRRGGRQEASLQPLEVPGTQSVGYEKWHQRATTLVHPTFVRLTAPGPTARINHEATRRSQECRSAGGAIRDSTRVSGSRRQRIEHHIHDLATPLQLFPSPRS
jgi:hypothetical protein